MKTKVPFAIRCLVICLLMLAASGTIACKLVKLQGAEAQKCREKAEAGFLDSERLPALRGLVMDCNEEILTNNLQSAQLVADRCHLREVSVVVNGLAFNQATTDAKWATCKNEDERRKLINDYRRMLLDRAVSRLSAEEKAERALKMGNDARATLLQEYDEAACEQYFAAHDRLVAKLLIPYLANEEVEVKQPGGKIVRQKITEDYIVEKIAQPETEKAVREALERNEKPTRNVINEIVLVKNLTLDKADKIRADLKAARVRGVTVQEQLRREYVAPERLCHVLGYVNHENKGMSGVESQFQSYLAGIDGLREFRHGSHGEILSSKDDRYQAAKDGLNLRLTIDMRIQNIVEQELERGLRYFRAPRGCMIVVEPQTGNILAMASRPSFDLNSKEVITPLSQEKVKRNSLKKDDGSFENGESNFACQARYEPGSTFKVVAVTAALDSGIMGINDWVDCNPFPVAGGKPVSDGRFNYGSLPLYGVLKKSSNPGTARVAFACKWNRYKDYLERYGLHTSTGIDLPSGGGCQVSDGSNNLNFSRIAYGYSVAVSPLHMAMVYATIANDGKRMRPRLIDCITRPDGSVYDECKPDEPVQVMKASTAADLRFALESVTELQGVKGRGTATRARIPGFRVGGKTGTVHKTRKGGGYSDGLYTVSFAGVFPIDDPKVVIMTVIDEPHPPTGNPGGGTVAAPIFRAAAERMIDVLNIAPSDPAAYEAWREKIRTEGRPENPYESNL